MTRSSAGTASLSPDQRAAFERTVARFEGAWFSGLRPVIEAFLPDDPGLRPPLLAELVRVDMEFRAKTGEAPQVDEYLARFPELAENESFVRSRARDSGELSFGEDRSVGGPRVGDSGPHVNVRSGSGQAGKPDVHPGQAGKPDVQALIASRLVTEPQVQECLKAVARDGAAAPEQLQAELVRRGWVTHWQLQQLARGQAEFFVDQGRYLLLGLIGQGGMGAVYKARHVRMNRDVALKVIDPKRVTDQSLIQRFRREVEVCSKLQNEHIVQAFDCGIHAGAIFLVLEFVEGSDLASLVKRDGPIRPDEAAAVCLQAAAGLAYAHSQGVVHRDIKPQNILLSSAGVVKILDMGLARLLDDPAGDPHTSLTQEGAVMGTVDYMPPEQARDTHLADARSDIYSLGGTLYYLLAGRPPFGGGSVIEKMQRLALEAPQSLTEVRIDCPPALDGIVQRMLAKRPEERFPTAGDVVRALRPFAAERIAGRTAVTAAVQAAADTMHAANVIPTDAELLFTHMNESLLTSVRQRLAPKRSSNLKQKLRFGAIVGGGVLLLMVAGWSLMSPPMPHSVLAPRQQKNSTPRASPPAPRTYRRVLPGHYGGILKLAWSPDGKHLATAGFDGQVIIRDPVTRKTRLVYDGHHAGICGLAWSPDASLIISGDFHGEIRVWQPQSGATKLVVHRKSRVPFHRIMYFEAGGVAISPDNQEIAYEDRLVATRYSLKENRELWKAPGGGAELHYSPTGEYLASSGGPYAWDTTTGDPVYARATFQVVIDDMLTQVALGFLKDDTLVIARDQAIHLWDCRERKLLAEIAIPRPVDSRKGPMVSISPAGDRVRVLTPTKWIDLELPVGEPTEHAWQTLLAEKPEISFGFSDWDLSFQRAKVARSLLSNVNLLDLNTGASSTPFRDEFLTIPSVYDARPIGNRFFSTGRSVWDVATATITRIPANAWRSGGDFVSSLHEDHMITQVASAEDPGDPPRAVLLEGLANAQSLWPTLALSADGKSVIGPTAEGGILSPTGITANGIRIWDAATGKLRKTLPFPEGKTERFLVSPDEKYLLFQAPGENLRIWDGVPDVPCRELKARFLVDLARADISPDGTRIAAGTIETEEGDDAVFVWNASDGSLQMTIRTGLNCFYDPYVVQFSATGRYLLVTQKIWDLNAAPPQLVWECPEPDHAVVSQSKAGYAFRFGQLFPDERHVLLARDAQLQIWDWREKDQKKAKLATLFWLPNYESVFVNHVTGHFSGSSSAYRFLRTDFEHESGRTAEETIREYEQRTGWKNDPAKAGLDLEKRNRELDSTVRLN